MSRADRIELGKELLNELEAKNIPVNDNLRNDLEHGVPKAIVNAEKKLANAETNDEAEQEVKPAEEATQFIAKNEPAENVTKQEVKAEKSAKEDTVLKGVSGIYESDIKDYIDRGYNIESYRGHLENGKPVYNLDFETSKDKARFVKDFYGESEEIDTDTSEPDYAKELDEEQEKKAGAEPAEEGNKKATDEGDKNNDKQAEVDKLANETSQVIVSGNEFGEYTDIKDLRKKALSYYSEHWQGIHVKNSKLGDIDIDNIDDVNEDNEAHVAEFTSSGKREIKSTSAKKEKLFLIKYLPKLIHQAVDLTDNTSQKERHANEHFYYLHTSALIEGKEIPVDITLIKRNDRSIQFYNLTLPSLENNKKNEPLVSSAPESPNGALGTPTVNGSSTSNISQEQKPGKGKVKQKGTERAGTDGNETVVKENGGEVSSEYTHGTETVQSLT